MKQINHIKNRWNMLKELLESDECFYSSELNHWIIESVNHSPTNEAVLHSRLNQQLSGGTSPHLLHTHQKHVWQYIILAHLLIKCNVWVPDEWDVVQRAAQIRSALKNQRRLTGWVIYPTNTHILWQYLLTACII